MDQKSTISEKKTKLKNIYFLKLCNNFFLCQQNVTKSQQKKNRFISILFCSLNNTFVKYCFFWFLTVKYKFMELSVDGLMHYIRILN
jgi:hypothetical protein